MYEWKYLKNILYYLTNTNFTDGNLLRTFIRTVENNCSDKIKSSFVLKDKIMQRYEKPEEETV